MSGMHLTPSPTIETFAVLRECSFKNNSGKTPLNALPKNCFFTKTSHLKFKY
jgi:hypothetical protein